MKPSEGARHAASITLSQGKMFEFGVPDEMRHLNVPADLDLALQFPLAIGTIGDFAGEELDDALGLETNSTPIEEVLFSAQVLIATIDAKVVDTFGGLVRVIAGTAFYLADSPGRAAAHCKNIERASFEPGDSLARALLSCLRSPWRPHRNEPGLPAAARRLLETLCSHYAGVTDANSVTSQAKLLKQWAHESGDAHELFISELLCALSVKRAINSARSLLPEYTGLESDSWGEYFQRTNALRDMWPSQRMLGESGVYSGKSAVVQMPTSAGKTRATELILRSAFRSGRTSLALVVAPFRALCYEIAQDLRLKFQSEYQVNQVSDALQQDYKLDLRDFLSYGVDSAPHVVVLTPEKLLYILRQEPDFVENVGLVVYDEGHQFDDSGRGVTYELLLTSVKKALKNKAQTILISAVISNASEIAKWLLDDGEKIVTDKSVQTSRHVAFASAERGYAGQLYFNATIAGEQNYFVPRVIDSHELAGKKPNSFPTENSKSTSLYLGMKLLKNGGVAVFVDRPESASGMIRDAVNDIFPRLFGMDFPSKVADEAELSKLVCLYSEHFSPDSFLTKGAAYGLFAHTGNTPQGIRLAVEHAMRESLISFIICTSTLAQGVNLPIRYLLISSPYQSGVLIKSRDFQNLVGRAGRAGMYGEGTIIFADYSLYDVKRTSRKKEWNEVQSLLSPDSSAPTSSALLRLISPLQNRYRKKYLPQPNYVELVADLANGDYGFYREVETTIDLLPTTDYFHWKDVEKQLDEKKKTVESLQSFLLSHQESFTVGGEFDAVRELAQSTYAHHLATDDEKVALEWAFTTIWSSIDEKKLDSNVKIRYGKSLLGLYSSQEIDDWVKSNIFELQLAETPEALLDAVWGYIDSLPFTKKLRKLEPAAARKALVHSWVQGEPFYKALAKSVAADGYLRHGEGKRVLSADAVVGLCQNEISFQSCLILSAMAASYAAISGTEEEKDDTGFLFDRLGRLMKYGLPSEEAAAVYEAGFSDRVVAQKVAELLPSDFSSLAMTKIYLRANQEDVRSLLGAYPSYFMDVMTTVVR